MIIDTALLRADIIERSHDRTHWEGCIYDPKHRDCMIVALLDRLATAEAVVKWSKRACEYAIADNMRNCDYRSLVNAIAAHDRATAAQGEAT